MSVDESPAEVPTPGALYGTDNPFGEGVELSEGTEAEVVDRPVSDWATDWSHTDPVWAADPFPIWDELRETCPVAHTDRFGGGWFLWALLGIFLAPIAIYVGFVVLLGVVWTRSARKAMREAQRRAGGG